MVKLSLLILLVLISSCKPIESSTTTATLKEKECWRKGKPMEECISGTILKKAKPCKTYLVCTGGTASRIKGANKNQTCTCAVTRRM